MKKKIQKYLAGEREGFSLVELIIVIAIMAILIGVIALAVIPNIQRSRESKDLTTLDNIMSATNVALANQKITANGSFVYGSAGAGIGKTVQDELGSVSLGAACNNGASITVSWTISTDGAAKVKVTTGTTCQYTKEDDGTTAKPMTVESSK